MEPFDLYAYYFYETPEEKHVVRKPHYLSLDEVSVISRVFVVPDGLFFILRREQSELRSPVVWPHLFLAQS